MTNSYNDMHNSRAMFLIGSNPAEAHPVAVQHIVKAKEQNNFASLFAIRSFTRTAAHADEYVRFRPGTDVALIWGILHHILKMVWRISNIQEGVWGMDQIRAEVKKWTPEEVRELLVCQVISLSGLPVRYNNRPGTIVCAWEECTDTNGNNNTRAYCVLMLALGNIGRAGGANIFRDTTTFRVPDFVFPHHRRAIMG